MIAPASANRQTGRAGAMATIPRSSSNWLILGGVMLAIGSVFFYIAYKSLWPKESSEPTRSDVLNADNEQLKAARAEAIKRLPEFLDLLHNRSGNDRFFVLAPIFDGHTSEWIWIKVESADKENVIGFVDTQPQKVTSAHLGDRRIVRIRDIGDWLYEGFGEPRGGFTTKVWNDIEAKRKAATQPKGATPTTGPATAPAQG
jgi:uncharacterized protein YegJ (DUF2314 family)